MRRKASRAAARQAERQSDKKGGSRRWLTILKRKSVSVGPAHASGWNWTEKKGSVEWMSPSLVPSLALTKNCDQPSGSEVASTAKPWFLRG